MRHEDYVYMCTILSFSSFPPSFPPSLPLFLTQTADQEAYDFFTSTVEDQPWPDIGQDAASHEGGEGEGAGERGGGEGEEMDTSVLLEQQVP